MECHSQFEKPETYTKVVIFWGEYKRFFVIIVKVVVSGKCANIWYKGECLFIAFNHKIIFHFDVNSKSANLQINSKLVN